MNGCCAEERRFLTREEKIRQLKEYKEAEGVSERIKEMEGE